MIFTPETEIEAARLVQDGSLPSGHQFENIRLFDIRITGTGVSYRTAHKEFVFRDPAIFATPEFAERCNALPVVLAHPDSGILDGEEFSNRVIGTVMLSYLKGDEVWGVVRIYDEDAAVVMATGEVSTSPGVRFSKDQLSILQIDNDALAIEGDPRLVDHIAVVPAGVWDKGGSPNGIRTDSSAQDGPGVDGPASAAADEATCAADEKDENMADEKEGDGARQDAANDLITKLDAICARMDAMGTRLDAFETKDDRKDAETEDKKETDAEPEKADDRADASVAENAALRATIDRMASQLGELTRPVTHEERNEIASIQSRADAVAQMFGEHASAPLAGESAKSYRKRILSAFQKHSVRFKDVRLDALDGSVLDEVERNIYNDAQSAAVTPQAMPAGRLIPVVTTDAAGRRVTRFHGDIKATFAQWMAPGVRARVVNPGRGGAN